MQTPRQAVLMDVSGDDWETRFLQLSAQGYHVLTLQGADTGGSGPAYYSGIWLREPSVPTWDEWRDMTAADYQTKFTQYYNQGLRPISVSGYQSSGANLFSAVWMQESAPYVGIDDATNAGYQAFVDEYENTSLRPQVVDGYLESGADYYISVWAQSGSGAWVARHGMTSAEYQTEITNLSAPSEGYRVFDVSAYEIGGTTYFAAYWVKDTLGWFAHHDYLPSDLFNVATSQAPQDWQPIVVEPYDTAGARNFAGIWIKKSRTWTATGVAPASLSAFETTMQTFMQQRSITSGALAVTRDSQLVFARGYSWDYDNLDPVVPTSLFRIASLTKSTTSMGIMRLVQLGQLSLSDLLVDRLALPAPKDPRMNEITILELLQHLGGWDRDTTSFDPMFADQIIATALGVGYPISQQNIIDYMTTMRDLDFAPGSMYDYSNYGYCLLGRVIEAVTGMAYGDYMQQHVFGPLHITRLRLGQSLFEDRQAGEVAYYTIYNTLQPNVRQAGLPTNAMSQYGAFNIENMDSHGGWLASAVDLARFATAFDSTGLYPVLTPSSIAQVFAQPVTGVFSDGSWYGCGWQVRTAGTGLNTWHNGSLTGTFTLMVRRYDGLDWVVLFNQRDDYNDPNGTQYDNIDGLLEDVPAEITTWPTGDLFPAYGLPVAAAHYTDLPLVAR
jgi:CubicO group peptidase (beta-lactamase class C family)